MGLFKLGKPAMAIVSTPDKLPLGKFDPALFGVHIVSPTDATVVLKSISYGSDAQELFPAVDPMNPTYDAATKKATFEFFIKNKNAETSPTVIVDDGHAAFWTPNPSGSGSLKTVVVTDNVEQKQSGENCGSIEMGADGAYAATGFVHNFAPSLNLSGKEFLCLHIKGPGAGAGGNTYWRLTDSVGVQASATINHSYAGYKWQVIPFRAMTNGTTFNRVVSSMQMFTYGNFAQWFIDRVVACNGKWVILEINVPDELGSSPNFAVYAYNQATGAYRETPFLTNVGYVQGEMQFLNQMLQSSIQVADKGAAVYGVGQSKQSLSVAAGDEAAGATVSTRQVKVTKKREFIAVLLPPDDGLDANNVGIGTLRVKIEVTCK